MLKEQILGLFSGTLRWELENANILWQQLQEIRIRVGNPMLLMMDGHEHFLKEVVTRKEIKGILDVACGYSGYAFEEEIKRGYITIAGGHRIGITGRAVVTSQGIQTIKDFSALNIRVAHSVDGCAKRWKEHFYKEGAPVHILLISPPGCGKTTFLRDMICNISDGDEKHPGVTVGVVDERSEIAGIYRGSPSFYMGKRTDILDGCPKSYGMEMLLRSMTPKVLAVDEIGSLDVPYIGNALRCGCKVFATMHGACMEDFTRKPGFANLVSEKVFDRYIFLKKGQLPGQVWKICDENFQVIWEDENCI